ncbi:MAG: DUF4339 domain-containing protein [Candidatus Cloacimonadaceae bacterium]|nr:DUF4339 domain-containing protein [Candidatus Cloacimonadaceae bacterium]MDP3113853.1 DUF4339 domain-containing protein [Candidatus Cloacimonadaceae bacterium]
MSKWFYSRNGKDLGPVSDARLVNAVFIGELDIDSSVLSAKTGLWLKIRDIPEIMEIIHKPLPKPIFSDVIAGEFAEFAHADIPIDSTQPIFYNLPPKKLMLMQLITFGLFQFYWFYKQWNYLASHSKTRTGSYFRALTRYVFFAYEIFHQISIHREMMKVKRAPWNPMHLTLLWYMVIPGLMINPFGRIPFISATMNFLLVFMLTSWVLIPVQRYINDVNEILKRPVSKPSFGFYFTAVVSIGFILGYLRLLIKTYFV